MKLLKIVFLFVLMQVISCHIYDELARDECFKKVYVCGDYRRSVTGGNGRFAAEPHRFSEICRKNKEFIACIEQAADFCSGKLTDLSRMILDNRRSLKLFCTDLEWKRSYFSSVKCINDNEKAVIDECIKEENEYEDDRSSTCLIPEPCESLERVFFCNIQKMKQRCGSAASEVYRRMHILKMENRDIVCEIRQRNPSYCHFQRQKPYKSESIKRIGSLSVTLSEAINKIFEEALVDTMDNFALLLNEENLSHLLDSDEYKLRKAIFKQEVEEKFRPFIKTCKLPEGELSQQSDLGARSLHLIFRNIKKILSEASFQNSKYALTLYENVLKFCGIEHVALTNCLVRFYELEVLKSLNPEAGTSKKLNAQLKSLKEYILGLFELLNCNEDFVVSNISEDVAVITWDNMNSFPLKTLSCEWKIVDSKQSFQCSFELKPADHKKDIKPDIMPNAEPSMKRENINKFLRPFNMETSLFTDSGSGMAGDLIMSIDGQDGVLYSTVQDTPEPDVRVLEIHRSGEQMKFEEEMDSEDVMNQKTDDVEMKSFERRRNAKQTRVKGDTENSVEETTYILVDPPSPKDSVSYLLVDANSNIVKPLHSHESSTLTVNAESSNSSPFEANSEKNEELKNLRLQLSKIVDALNERFANAEVRKYNFKENLRSDSEKRQSNFYQANRGYLNQSSQRELHDSLKQKLNTDYMIHGTRSKRQVIRERQNSKMDKSFITKSSNKTRRINDKFTNFEAEL